MPMGGLGSRFAKEGYTIPKPLIEVDGKPMFMRALDSFSSLENVVYIFVIRKEHDETYDLANKIHRQLPDAKIAILDHDTGGAVETCLIASDYIDDELPIVIADCDIYFESKQYFQKIYEAQLTGKPDGMLLTFTADNPRYSYVEIDADGKAIRTAEKVVISNHAILGGYFFSSGGLFKDLTVQFVSNDLPAGLKEYFMSHLFNMLIEKNKTIEIADVDKMHIFGTPEELTQYIALKGSPT
jgi:dTDP-glucose pyrophosphorylase